MKLQDRLGREVDAEAVALAACRELMRALERDTGKPDVKRAAVLARAGVLAALGVGILAALGWRLHALRVRRLDPLVPL